MLRTASTSEGRMTHNSRSPLDVFYRGERNYIQGSLIISLCAEKLTEMLPAEKHPVFLREAKFSALINQAVDYSFSAKPEHGGAGTLRFSTGDQDFIATIFAADQPSPPRRPDEVSRIVDLAEGARLCGEAGYRDLASFDDAISAVVELNKELHARLSDDLEDIWFAGLRNAELPVAGSPFGASGRITLDLMVERPWQDRILTLSQVAVHPDHCPPMTFEITYSSRNRQQSTEA